MFHAPSISSMDTENRTSEAITLSFPKLTLVLVPIHEKFIPGGQFSPTTPRFGSGASTFFTRPLTGQQLWEYGMFRPVHLMIIELF